MKSSPARGRRQGRSTSRELILASARKLFAEGVVDAAGFPRTASTVMGLMLARYLLTIGGPA